MSHKTLVGLSLVLSVFFQQTSAFADSSCPKPIPNAATAFSIIENPKLHTTTLKAFLETHTVARSALNERCENMYMLAIRLRNQSALNDLDEIGYGPTTGEQLNKVEKNYSSIYEYALMYGDLNLIKKYKTLGGALALEAWFFFKDKDIDPLIGELHVAASENTADVVSYFLSQNKDKTTTLPSSGTTVLMQAARWNPRVEVIELLIKESSDIDAKEKGTTNNYTALMYATSVNKLSIVKALIEAGANRYAKDDFDNTILTLAASNNKPGVTQYVLSLVPELANVPNKDGRLPLHYAAATIKDPPTIEALIRKTSDIHTTDQFGNDALIYAAASATPKVVQSFVKAGATATTANKTGVTALINAAQYERTGIALYRTLLSAHADKSAKDSNGKTAYDFAVENKLPLKIQELLKP